MVGTPEVLPPSTSVGIVGWLKTNLFSSPVNVALTVVVGTLTAIAAVAMSRWLVFADWSPIHESLKLFLVGQYPSEELWRVGAVVVGATALMGVSWAVWGGVMRTFARIVAAAGLIVAFTPIEPAGFDLAVRLWYLGSAASVALGFAVGRAASPGPKWVIRAWALAFFLGMALIWGFDERSIGSSLRMLFGAGATLTAVLAGAGWVGRFPLAVVLRWLAWGWAVVFVVTIVMAWGLGQTDLAPRVNTNQWGGLLLTFVLALVGIVASFPIGVLLALGRRSRLPVLKGLSVAFIELVRGVPLVTLLFMTVVIVPLFLPQGTTFDLVLRAVFAITLFSSAYMAENVRGGLAAVPLGQIEGAKALGLGGFQTMLFIVLPQALRAVIPAIVGQFISLYKDTSLVVIVGLLDILGIGKSLFLGNVRWFGAQAEVYLFVAAVFWVFTFSMAYASRKVEESLGVGSR